MSPLMQCWHGAHPDPTPKRILTKSSRELKTENCVGHVRVHSDNTQPLSSYQCESRIPTTAMSARISHNDVHI